MSTRQTALDILITALRESPHPYVVVRELYILGEDVRRLLSPLDHDAMIRPGSDNTWVSQDFHGETWILDPIVGYWDSIPTDDGERQIWEEILTHSDPP